MKTQKNALASVLLVSLASIAGAQTTSTWSLAGNGDWKNAAHWDTANYPDNGQPVLGDTYNAVLNTNRTITLDGSVSIQGITLSAGTITGAADKTLTLAGPFAWSGGILTGGMTVQANGGATISNNVNHELNGGTIFNNTGTMNWTAGNVGNNFGSWTFNNSASGVINVNLTSSPQALGTVHSGGKTISNAGTINVASAIAGNYLDLQNPLDNSGLIDVTGSYIILRGGTNTGQIQVAAGRTVQFSSNPFTQSGSGSITGAGHVQGVGGGPIYFNAGSTYNVGSTLVHSSDMYYNTTATTGTLSLLNSGRLFGSGRIDVNGLFQWSGGGYPNINGSVQIHAHEDISLTGSTKSLDGLSQVHNYATVSWTSGEIHHANWSSNGVASVINNHVGATFEMTAPDGHIYGDQVVSRFFNSGTFTRSAGTHNASITSRFHNFGTGILNLNSGSATMHLLVNNGIVNVNSGTLWMQEGIADAWAWQTGAFNLANGTTLRIGNNSSMIFGSTSAITGGSELWISAGSPTFKAGMTFAPAGLVNISGGSATFEFDAIFPSLQFTGGSLQGANQMTVTGPMTWAGNLYGTGLPHLNALGGLTINGGFRYLNGRILRNHGSATWSSGEISSGNGAEFRNLAGATLANNFAGTFSHSGGTNPVFLNQGTFIKTNGTTTFAANTTFTNEGLVQIQSGTLAAVQTLTNAGTLLLEGGNLTAMSTLPNYGTLAGAGLVTGRPENSGTVRAQGGTLTISNGIAGTGGNIEIAAAASLVLNGAGSTVANLTHSGTGLTLAADITVHSDYQNTNFGLGNAFNPRANVNGSGNILAAGPAGQSITGSLVSNGSSSTPTIQFPTIRQGQTTAATFQIHNPGSTGPLLRGALQTNVNGANMTDARLSGSGVTAGNFSVQPTTSTAAYTIEFTGTAGGPLTNQKITLLNQFSNVLDQTVTINGSVWGLAQPQITSTTPIAFGNVRLGKILSYMPLAIKNNAPADGWHEGLSVVPQLTNLENDGAGIITALLPQATNNTAIAVRIPTNVVGLVDGEILLPFTSDGTGTSGITPNQTLTPQTIDVTGTVYALASPSLAQTSYEFGSSRVGDVVAPFVLEIANAAGTYREGLHAEFNSLTVPPAFQVSGSIANLAPGASNTAMQISLDTSTPGKKNSEALRIIFSSDGVATAESPLAFAPEKISLGGTVWQPAIPVIPGAPNFSLGNVRVGSTSGLFLSVGNDAPADGYSEELMATFLTASNGDFSFNGLVKHLAPQSLDTGSLTVEFDTTTVGPRVGQAMISLASNGDNTSGIPDELALPTQTLNLSAGVFRPAEADANDQIIGYVRKEQAASFTGNIVIKNVAVADGYSERLIARINGVGPNLTIVEDESSLIDPDGGDESLRVTMTGLASAERGPVSGNVSLTYATTGGGVPATSGLPELAIGSESINVIVQVNGEAYPGFSKTSGSSGTTFSSMVGNFGTTPLHLGPRNLVLKMSNGSSDSYSDSLKATFDTSGIGPFGFVPPAAIPSQGLAGGEFRNFTITLNPVGLPPGLVTGTLVIHPVSSNPTSDLALAPLEIELRATIPEPYQAWVSRYTLTGDDALATSDPDDDGHDNYKEFAFGGNPNDPASGPVVIPRILEDTNGKYLATLVRVRKGNQSPFAPPAEPPPLGLTVRAIRDGIRYTVTGSTAPGGGTASLVAEVLPPTGFADIPASLETDYSDVVIRFQANVTTLPTGFLQVEATPAP